MSRRKKRSFGAIRKLPSGNYQASFVDSNGRRKNAQSTFLTKVDAEGWLGIVQYRISRGEDYHSTQGGKKVYPTFRDYALRHISIQVSPTGDMLRQNTVDLYFRLLENHLKTFENISINLITSEQVSNWFASLVKSGKKTSAAKAYTLGAAVYRRAIHEKLVSESPFQVKGARRVKTGKAVAVPTFEEFRRIIDSTPGKYRKLFVFLAVTGLRFSEASELRVGDFELRETEGRYQFFINVRRRAVVTSLGIQVGPPKTSASTRRLAMPMTMNDEIRHLISSRQANDLVFPGSLNGHLRGDSASKVFARAVAASGVQKQGLTLHSLRHFAASVYGSYGASLVEIKDFLGHSSSLVSLRYLHSQGREIELANRIEYRDYI